MAAFDDLAYLLEEFSGRVRLLPLPNLVLFPHVIQPLHIFERRYRDLLEDSLAGDRLVAVASLLPDQASVGARSSDLRRRAAIYPMACLGRITMHHRLSDGTYNMLVAGLRRVKIVGALAPTRRFREAKVRLCTDVYAACPVAHQHAMQRQLRQALVHILPMLPQAEEQLDQLLGDDVPLGLLTDVIGYLLDLDIADKLSLLGEVNVCRRVQMLLGHLSGAVAELSVGRARLSAFPPQFSNN